MFSAEWLAVSHAVLLPLAWCKSVFSFIGPLEQSSGTSGAGGTDKVPFASSRRTLVSQASRTGFVLHCALALLKEDRNCVGSAGCDDVCGVTPR